MGRRYGGKSNGNSTKTYYIDATSGSDANSGKSEGAPWKTLSRLSDEAFNETTTIKLKRGEVWYEQLTVPAPNITIDAYGTGNSAYGHLSLNGVFTTMAFALNIDNTNHHFIHSKDAGNNHRSGGSTSDARHLSLRLCQG